MKPLRHCATITEHVFPSEKGADDILVIGNGSRRCHPITTILQAQLFLPSNFGKNLLCTLVRNCSTNTIENLLRSNQKTFRDFADTPDAALLELHPVVSQ